MPDRRGIERVSNDSNEESISLPKLLSENGKELEAVGIESGRVEAEMILCHVLSIDRLTLYLHGQTLLKPDHLVEIERIVKKRLSRFPLQYILGESWFYGRRFSVTKDVMIPTPETEQLCEYALKSVSFMQISSPRILDIGTGSGVIGITMACELPESRVVAVDLSEEALEVARGNAEQNRVDGRVEFRCSDILSAIQKDEKFDLILSNPPYICETVYDDLPPEVLADPKLAITSGDDGLDAIRRIVKSAPDYLAPSGKIIFEIGYDQALLVASLTEGDSRYQTIDILKDYNDIDRIVALTCGN